MNVDLIYMDAGGGHRASATALRAVLQERMAHWDVRMSNLFSILDPQDQFKKLTGKRPEDFYNSRLAKGWTLGMAQELKLLQFSIGLLHERLKIPLRAHWQRTGPDLVISLIPNFNRALYESLKAAVPAAQFVTLLTDLADHPPNFWIEPGQNQFFICGTPWAARQAIAMGHPPERIFTTSGMVLHPRFYAPRPLDRAVERRKLGLDPELPTGLVIFGGHGSSKMLRIAQSLADTQLILVCGRNRRLAARLRKIRPSASHLVIEFTDEVPFYMALADFFIGKPGPGSISEAIAMGLPVIVESNAWTMPQEIYNAQWVAEQGTGVVIRSLRQIAPAVSAVIGDLARYRARLKLVENRAVFEIPTILQQIIEPSRTRCTATQVRDLAASASARAQL